MSSRKNAGSTPARLQGAPSLSVADIQALTRHPQIQVANQTLSKALEAITGWNMTAKRGIPREAFKLAVQYEDALGLVKEAYIAATLEWLLTRTCPLCGSRPQRSKVGKRQWFAGGYLANGSSRRNSRNR